MKTIIPLPKIITVDVQIKFWMKVDRKSEDECWNWTASQFQKYGQLEILGRSYRANRISYMIHYGDPGTKLVCHTCDNTKCVNPNHLFLGDNSLNQQDSHDKGRHYQKGSHNGCAKLSEEDIPKIHKLLGVVSQRQIAKLFNVSRGTIQSVARNKSWSHV